MAPSWLDVGLPLLCTLILGVVLGYRASRRLFRQTTLDWPELLKLQVPTIRGYVDMLEAEVETLESRVDSAEERAQNWKGAAKGYRTAARAWQETSARRRQCWLTHMTDAEVRALDMIVSDGCAFLGAEFQQLREQMMAERQASHAAHGARPVPDGEMMSPSDDTRRAGESLP